MLSSHQLNTNQDSSGIFIEKKKWKKIRIQTYLQQFRLSGMCGLRLELVEFNVDLIRLAKKIKTVP